MPNWEGVTQVVDTVANETSTSIWSMNQAESEISNYEYSTNNVDHNWWEDIAVVDDSNQSISVKKEKKEVDKSWDWVVREILNREKNRQKYGLEMIASENYVSKDVLSAMSNVFTNKYSEGYPWAKWYWWQEECEYIELLAQFRALKMFNIIDRNLEEDNKDNIIEVLKNSEWSCNVQPLSWSPANAAVMLNLLNPGDTILWMDLNAWWHLSHGFKSNFSWKIYNIESYWVTPNNYLIDYETLEKKLIEKKPKMIILWFSAYSRNIDWKKIKDIVDRNEKVLWYRPFLLADISHIAWLIVSGNLENPVPYVDIITTTTHKTLRWPRWAIILSKKSKTVTKVMKKVVDWKEIQENKQFSISWLIDSWVFPWIQWWPHMHVILAKAVAFREAIQPDFQEYGKKVIGHAKALANKLSANWWHVLTWWTDNHIVLFDVTKVKDYISYNDDWAQVINYKDTWLRGKEAQQILDYIWISTNKNSLPYDVNPVNPSWIRLWTAAITTRWLWYKEIEQLADLITEALQLKNVELKRMNWIANAVKKICVKFPL